MMKISHVAMFAMLCLSGTVFGQTFNQEYHYSGLNGTYSAENDGSQSTLKINANEIITVGSIKEGPGASDHDVLMVKTRVDNGHVIWSRRIGLPNLDEYANAVTLSYSGEDLLIVGHLRTNGASFDRDAFVLRVQVSDGGLLWMKRYGTPEFIQEWKMIEKVGNGNSTYFLAGYSQRGDNLPDIFAAAIHEDGSTQFLNKYVDQSPLIRYYAGASPSTMVQNNQGNFILAGEWIAGTNKRSTLFSIGINPVSGIVTDPYLTHHIPNTDEVSLGAIEQVTVGGTEAYILSGTALSPNVSDPIVNTAVSIMTLNSNRTPIGYRLYWTEGSSFNSGLNVFQNQVNNLQVDVFTSLSGKPAVLKLNLANGQPISLKRYNTHDEQASVSSISMVQTDDGYIAKSNFITGGLFGNTKGFKLISLDNNGNNECFSDLFVLSETKSIESSSIPFGPIPFGTVNARGGGWPQGVVGKSVNCDGTDALAFRRAVTTDQTVQDKEEFEEAFSVFPNPIASNGNNLSLEYSVAEEKQVEVSVFNAIGQQVTMKQVTLSSGSNVLELDKQFLSKGLNLITLRSNGEVLYQERVIMH